MNRQVDGDFMYFNVHKFSILLYKGHRLDTDYVETSDKLQLHKKGKFPKTTIVNR